MSDTCLFSNEALDSNTKIEHTIPESVGGRITSTFVSSTCMNELAGERLDAHLKNPYKLFFSILGPALPVRIRSALSVSTDNDHPGLVLDGVGGLTRRNVVVEKDSSGKPTAVLAADEAAARKVANQIAGENAQLKVRTVPTTLETGLTEKHLAISAEIDVAVLRTLLLTFDHVLRGTTHRFTRSPKVEWVRAFMHRTISGDPLDHETLRRLSLGIQYEKLPLYREIRQSCDFPHTPFEHVLFASATRATRTLDLVWVFAETDPYAFRVCDDWDGEDFTYVVVNGITSDTNASGALAVAPMGTLGKPTLRSSFPNAFFSSEEEARAAAAEVMVEIGVHRLASLELALRFIEETYDEYVVDRLVSGARLSGVLSITSTVESRLIRIFACAGNTAAEAVIHEVVDQLVNNLPSSVRQEAIDATGDSTASWPEWLRLYRTAMGELRERLGTIGGFHSKGIELSLDVSAARKLGDVRPSH